jgi:hypothetical protein
MVLGHTQNIANKLGKTLFRWKLKMWSTCSESMHPIPVSLSLPDELGDALFRVNSLTLSPRVPWTFAKYC